MVLMHKPSTEMGNNWLTCMVCTDKMKWKIHVGLCSICWFVTYLWILGCRAYFAQVYWIKCDIPLIQYTFRYFATIQQLKGSMVILYTPCRLSNEARVKHGQNIPIKEIYWHLKMKNLCLVKNRQEDKKDNFNKESRMALVAERCILTVLILFMLLI